MRRTIKALLIMVCVLVSAFAVTACFGDTSTTEKTTIESPVIASKVYNGEKQTATIAASDDYEVTENAGGTDVGEYNVVLTLKNADKAKWKTPDNGDETKLTLKFSITKATNAVTSLTLKGWAAGSEPESPAAKATFGTVKFTYSTEENGTYTETVPTAAGKYYVKATVEGTKNYDGAEKTLAFEISKTLATVTEAPVANTGLIVNDDLSEQVLVTAGSVSGGVMVYALIEGEETVPSQELLNPSEWSTELPKAGKAGKYTVYYMAKGDENHSDSEYGKVVVEISKKANAISNFTVANVKYGETPAPSATAENGTVVFAYSLTEDGEYVAWENVAKRAGEYFVKATVEAGDVYLGATEVISFTMSKADNAIADFTIAAIKCHEAPELTATATAGTITYKYATATDGEYADLTAETKLAAGTYYVKAYTEGDENHNAAESNAAELIVSHNLVWDKTGETEDVEKCACGQTGRTFVKAITEKNAQRVSLNVGAENGSAVLDEYSYGLISLAGISDYASVESVKLGDKTITLNTFAGEEELAGGKIAVNVKDFGFAYGEQNVVVTVKCEEGDTHEVNVKVLLITAILNNKAELNNFGVIAKACETDSDAWGGYFELGADIEYNGYWSDFVNADSNDALKAMQGFKGVFDGQGHNVKGMRIARISVAGTDVGAGIIKVGAFIPKLHKDGILRNVSFTEAAVGSERSFLVYCGNGLIENIFVKYACFGDSSYAGYSAGHNYGATTTVFAKGEGEGAIVRNVIIDVSECVGIATQADNVNGYIVGQFNKVETLSNVYVINPSDKYNHIVRNISVSSETKIETDFDAGVNYFVYKSFAEMAADETRNYEGFVAPLWTVKEGGLPYVKAQNVAAPAFTTAPSEITKGSSATFVVSANVRLALDEAAAAAGLTLENGVVSVPEGIGDATYTLIATSLFDPTLKTEVTFNVINARKYETITNAQEINLNVANDGSVNSSASAEIDLTEKFTGNASLSLVKVGDEIISGFEGVEIVGGKATLNVAPFGIKYYGEKEVKLVFTSEGVDYEYTVPVNFITKTIMNGDANVRAIKTLVTALQGGGYYRLGENVTLKWNFYANSDDYRIAVDYPFIGTLDGNGYAINGLIMWSWTAGGFIQNLGETGVIKNIAFKGVQLGGYTAVVYQGSGTIENVFVEVAAFPAAYGQPNKNWRNGELTIFGWQSKANDFKLKNVLADFTPASAKIKEFVGQEGMVNKMIFGASTKPVTAVNTVVLGIPDNYDKAQITNYGGVYVRYTDETDNGIAFPVSGWDETYWTIGENAVSWKTK